MFFKAKFDDHVDESIGNDFCIDFDLYREKEVIYFKNHEFEIERDNLGLIKELTYCNQCVQTFDIENVFLELISLLLMEDELVTLFDSDGYEEMLTKDDFPQN